MTTFDALGLPIFATTDKIAATGDGLREDLNLITASTGNAIQAEGSRAEGAAVASASSYTDTKDASNRSAWAAADSLKLTEAKNYADLKKSEAIGAAAADATSKANTAETNAKAYSDGKGYLPVWKASTAYTAGQRVIAPNGDIVSAKVAFTSGTTYLATNWNPSTGYTAHDTAIADAKWFKADLSGTTDLNTYNTTALQGFYRIQATTVVNLPVAALGYLTVRRNATDGRTTQVFTRSQPGPVIEYSRVYSGGAWGPWTNYGWIRPTLASGTDLDTIRDFGAYPIDSLTLVNMPAAVVGTLEVLPSSSLQMQRYITREATPRTFVRYAPTTTTWGAWSTPATGGGGTGTGGDFSTPVRAALTTMTTTETTKSAGSIVVALSPDRTKGYNCYSTTLRETSDEGATWTDLKAFSGMSTEYVTALGNGELLVSATDGAKNRHVFVSDGYPTLGAGAAWPEKFVGSSKYVKFGMFGSVHTYKNIVLVNEYGPKSGYVWDAADGTVIASGANARYTRMSLDYGKTWRTIFDLNTFTASKGLSGDGQHLHGVAWDQYWDRIWITFGDNLGGAGSNGVLYSDDLGDTWQEAHFYNSAGATTQVVGIQPMPKCILFAGDMEPSGLMRINRSEGKQRTGHYTYEVAYDFDPAKGTHLCQQHVRADRAGDDGVAFFGFSSEGSSAPSILVATLDGYTVTTVYEDAVFQPSGSGIRNVAGPTLKGNLILASQRGGTWSEIKGKAPGY